MNSYTYETTLEELEDLVFYASAAAEHGWSNDIHIEALSRALNVALSLIPEWVAFGHDVSFG